MLKLRKILLCDWLYYIILLLVIIISIIRLSIPLTSKYTGKEKETIGIITKINIKNNKVTFFIKGKEQLIVTYYLKNNKKIDVSIGDKIKVFGTLEKPSLNSNTSLFNYRKYLKRKKVFYILKCKKYIIISKNKNIYYYLKKLLIKRLNNNPYLYTFILGDKSLLKESVKRSYQSNGISHLFAITATS